MPNSRSYNSDFTRSSVFIIYLIISKAFEEKSMWFTYFFAVFFFFLVAKLKWYSGDSNLDLSYSTYMFLTNIK